MNERIQELIDRCTTHYNGGLGTEIEVFDKEKFAELIVRECSKTIENRAPGQMGYKGEGWTNGYDDGLKTGAWLIKHHFGVKE